MAAQPCWLAQHCQEADGLADLDQVLVGVANVTVDFIVPVDPGDHEEWHSESATPHTTGRYRPRLDS
jgi:hypothetical protein